MNTQNFYECRFDKYSQNGEDGILEELIDILKIDKVFFVEFGAWDGKKMSNCAYLSQKGWRGCFIEGDPKRFLSLKNNYPCDSILKLNLYVSPDGQNTYDKIRPSKNRPQRGKPLPGIWTSLQAGFLVSQRLSS